MRATRDARFNEEPPFGADNPADEFDDIDPAAFYETADPQRRGTSKTPGRRGARTPDPPQADPPDSPVKYMLQAEHFGPGFLRVPVNVIHGEVGALLERIAPGLGWLFVVLLRYADRQERVIRASKRTLCKETGVLEDRTLDRRLAVLCKGDTRVGLPPLLERLSETGVLYKFRYEGLEALAAHARRVLDARRKKYDAIRQAQRAGGRKGARIRWSGWSAAMAEEDMIRMGLGWPEEGE